MANAYNVNDNVDQPDSPDQQEASPQLILTAFMAMPNIVPQLDDQKLSEIAHKVIEEYDIDKRSREDWETRIEAAMKLAMLVSEVKTYPWKGAANIKYPLLTVAALQFNARAYPAIVQGNRVVKCTTWGRDPQGTKAARGDRVSEFMSYQLLAQQPEWEEDTDRMLVILPIVGCAFRKVYYDPAVKRNTTRLVTADRFVVNYFARSLVDAPRVTEEMRLYPYEIQERIRAGLFIDFDYSGAPADIVESKETKQPTDNDKDAPHLFLEQHRLLDLDEDGYTEPYIVTVHHSTQKVCRITANFSEDTITFDDQGKVAAVRKQQYYVKYQFMPSPDGGFYGMGFGWLTKDLSEAINTLNNQMLDAGHLSVVQGGLVSGQLGIKEKKITLQPGEWRVITTSVPMNQAVYPINYPGPSAVLFNLLGLMVDAGKDITGVKDVLTGEGQGKNASPTTTMALIEQGLQQFTAIYKRIHRSLKQELGILAGLNKKYVDPQVYAEFFDEPQQQAIAGPQGAPDPQAVGSQQPQLPAPGGAPMPGPQQALGADPNAMPQQALGAQAAPQGPPDPKADFDETDMDILPISDPASVSKMQKLAKAEFIYQTAKENPRVDQGEALKRMFEAADIDKTDELILPPQQPDPETVALTKRGAEAEVADLEAKVELTKAQRDLAEAQVEDILINHLGQQADTQNGQPVDPAAIAAQAKQNVQVNNDKAKHDNQIALDTKKHNDLMALENKKLKQQRELALAANKMKDKTQADGTVQPVDKQDEANTAMIDALKGLSDAQKGTIEALAELKAVQSAPKKITVKKAKDGSMQAEVTQ